ncbi:hypothetical protein BaRGS_00032945 [Batillaria attramentaria]|uniref:Uncharacterized protein n=1 Tax=Batillaria attramentaria TaxID=370345 RepID=A0ABD0JLQ5_9CAEN
MAVGHVHNAEETVKEKKADTHSPTLSSCRSPGTLVRSVGGSNTEVIVLRQCQQLRPNMKHLFVAWLMLLLCGSEAKVGTACTAESDDECVANSAACPAAGSQSVTCSCATNFSPSGDNTKCCKPQYVCHF